MKSVHIEQPGSKEWINSFVCMADYLANPAIEKKNSLILDELTGSYLPELQKDKQLYADFKGAIGQLLEDCYNMTTET